MTNVRSPPRALSTITPARYLPRGVKGCVFALAHNEHDSLVRTPLLCTTAIWKIICHTGGDGGDGWGGGRGLAGGGTHTPLVRAGRLFRLHTPSVFSPYVHTTRRSGVDREHVQKSTLFASGWDHCRATLFLIAWNAERLCKFYSN